ncbi:MAG: hypothetical protein JO058_18315 [Alphaproteobacteria bacterium]|nr:hypothetical protein [Alphaproteobacteria bacterium]
MAAGGSILSFPNRGPWALEPLIDSFCPRDGIVLDPFAGSGSSLIAARNRGRRFVGIELDPEHYLTASERLAGISHHSQAA